MDKAKAQDADAKAGAAKTLGSGSRSSKAGTPKPGATKAGSKPGPKATSRSGASAEPRTEPRIERQAAESTNALNALVGFRRSEMLKSLGMMAGYAARQPVPFAKHLSNYVGEMASVLAGTSELAPHPRDRRFRDESWMSNPLYKRTLQSWLAMKRELEGWISDSRMHPADQARARFLTNLVVDAVSPSNALLTNPSALKMMVATKGESVIKGLQNAYDDIVNNGGLPQMVDRRPFTLGENVAASPGAVVYRSPMFELIQYEPQTEEVFEYPILMIPPQINKFYAHDMSPGKSMVEHLTRNGYQTFIISWRNPSREHAHWGLADYVESCIEAGEVVKAITGAERYNVTGACSGGATMALTLNELAARGDNSVNCYSLFVAVLDGKRSDSEIGLFVTPAGIEAARRHSARHGILAGEELSRMFAWMRPNDLIWNYVVNNYLLGLDPPPFDILYWNADATNLPAALHSDYLDIFRHRLFRPDREWVFLDHFVDLGNVAQDGFLVAGVTDHITPWIAVYRNIRLFGGDIDFVLSNSGHLQSLLNPPGNPKARYYASPQGQEDYPARATEWRKGAVEHNESWWLRWTEWLGTRSGGMKAAPKALGSEAHPPLTAAPGDYVHG